MSEKKICLVKKVLSKSEVQIVTVSNLQQLGRAPPCRTGHAVCKGCPQKQVGGPSARRGLTVPHPAIALNEDARESDPRGSSGATAPARRPPSGGVPVSPSPRPSPREDSRGKEEQGKAEGGKAPPPSLKRPYPTSPQSRPSSAKAGAAVSRSA